MPQETALYEELSAWDNLDFHADLFGVARQEKKKRIMQMLDLVQLQERQHSRVSTFSGGMKRRLALARALLHNPQLLYLDEPTLGVDVQSRRAIWDYILALKEQGKTVLITTNYLEEAQALCERIAILDHGKLIAVELETVQRIDVADDLRAKRVEQARALAWLIIVASPPMVISVLLLGLAGFEMALSPWLMWPHPASQEARARTRPLLSFLLFDALGLLTVVFSLVDGPAWLWLFIGVSALGGWMEAGPLDATDKEGFRVHVELPLPASGEAVLLQEERA